MNSNLGLKAALKQFVNDCKRVGFRLDVDFDVNNPDVIQVAQTYADLINTTEHRHSRFNALRTEMWNACSRSILLLERL